MDTPMTRWQNWGLNQACEPDRIASPSSPEEVVDEVRDALGRGRRVRAAGSGHSIMPIVPTDGLLIDPSKLTGITDIDPATGVATVLAGTRLCDLGPVLWDAGFSLPNQGDIDVQTVAGATSTATKGSGVDYPNLSASITEVQLVDGAGELRTIDAGDDFLAAKVSLGLLGVITSLKMRMLPRYFLRERNTIMSYGDIIEQWDELQAAHRHFSFWWMPNDRAHSLYGFEPVPTDSAMVKLLDEVELDESFALDRGPEGRTGRAYLVYPDTTTDPTFHELEFMVPADRGLEGFQALRELMTTSHPEVDSPVQIRWQKADDAWLSSQSGRDSVSISVSGVIGTDYTPFFREVQELLMPLEARPHWGKWNAFTGADLARVFPHWHDFRAVRDRFDPEARFANDYFADLLELGRP